MSELEIVSTRAEVANIERMGWFPQMRRGESIGLLFKGKDAQEYVCNLLREGYSVIVKVVRDEQ